MGLSFRAKLHPSHLDTVIDRSSQVDGPAHLAGNAAPAAVTSMCSGRIDIRAFPVTPGGTAQMISLPSGRPENDPIVPDHPAGQEIGQADKVGHETVGRLLVDFFGRPHLKVRPAFMTKIRSTSPSLGLVMGHVDDRHPDAGLEVLDLEPHLFAELRVQIGERLVQEEHIGLHDQGPPQGHPLLLAPES